MVVEGGIDGLFLVGNMIHLESGAVLEADHVVINVTTMIVEELAFVDLNAKVTFKSNYVVDPTLLYKCVSIA